MPYRSKRFLHIRTALAVMLAAPALAAAIPASAQNNIGAETAAALPERGEFFLGLFNEGERDGFMRLGWIKSAEGVLLYDRSMMPSAQVYETLAFGLTPELAFDSVHLEFHRGLAYMNLDLDAENGQQVMDLFTRLARAHQMTTLMVTHSLEIARLADRVLTIQDGQLVAAAEPQETTI